MGGQDVVAQGEAGPTVKLADLVANSAEIMKLDLARIRLATKHPGLKGSGAEEILARFLRQRLPASLGITTGHVVDSKGNLSRQQDVIIYDAQRTPILFESALDGWDVVPAEGVVAVVEVKMTLSPADLPKVITNCESVMALTRDAYIGEPVSRVSAYDRTWAELPIYYSLFVFEAEQIYSAQLNALLDGKPVHERVGSVCYLNQGLSLHADLSTGTASYSAFPTSLAMFDIPTPNALLVWLTSLCTVVLQVTGRPINLMHYAPDEHKLEGGLPQTSPEAGRKLAMAGGVQVMVAKLGMDRSLAETILMKTFDRVPLTEQEKVAITGPGGSVLDKADGSQRIVFPP